MLRARDSISNRGLKLLCRQNVSLVDPHTLHLTRRIAVTLSGLLCISPFACLGEPATLARTALGQVTGNPSSNCTWQLRG